MTEIARSPLRVLLVDDSEIVRRGVRAVLESASPPAIQVVGEAGTLATGVATCLRLKPHVVLLDIRLPDGDGFEACRQILAKLPATRIVMLTAHSNDSLVYDAVTSGAHGYLMKEVDGAALIQAVVDVAAGRSILDLEATARVLRLLRSENPSSQKSKLALLSVQERRVLALVADGLTNKQAGVRLRLSENTVKNYLMNVFGKLEVRRRAHAAALYVKQKRATNDSPKET